MDFRAVWVLGAGLALAQPAWANPWTVCSGGGCDFTTVGAAVGDVNTLDGHAIHVSSGTYAESFTVDKNLDIVAIDGPGTASIEGTSNNMITLSGNSYVSFTDFTIGEAGGASRRCFYVNTGSTLDLDTVTVRNCTRNAHGAGIGMADGGSAIVHNSTFTGNDVTGGTDRRGPHIDAKGVVTISDSHFELGIGALSGGIYAAVGSVLTISNTTFDQNNATEDFGGAIHIVDGTLDCQDCTFTNNVAYLEGGAVYVSGAVSASYEGGSFDNNYGWMGGGLFGSTSQDLLIRQVDFTNNSADHLGGAVFYQASAAQSASVEIDQSLFTSNDSMATYTGVGDGGAVFISQALAATLTGNIFRQNIAQRYGGGVFIESSTTVDVLRNEVCDNYAVDDGGGVFQEGGSAVTFSNNRIQDNESDDRGGGIYVNYAPARYFTNNTFAGNEAVVGAGLRCFQCDMVVNSNIFADQVGDALAASAPSSHTIDFNLWSGNTDDITGDLDDTDKGGGAVNAGPQFVDWTADDTCNDDLHLAAGSPAIDRGDDDPARNDLDGTRNDIGAYGGPSAPDEDIDGDGVDVPADCDDSDPNVFPGAAEVPADGIDQDCDGFDHCYLDADSDGYGSATVPASAGTTLDCTGPNESLTADDCDDSTAAVAPNASEIPGDGVDQDCDGQEECYVDGDGDGHAGDSTAISVDLDCDDAGEFAVSDDCDDGDGAISPSAVEGTADGIDQDCDGLEECYEDGDLDGYGGVGVVLDADLSCTASGLDTASEDCDDGDPNVSPGAAEILVDGIDQDCIDGDLCYFDGDQDGHGDAGGATFTDGDLSCTGAFESDVNDDCNDNAPTVYVGAPEVVADGVDQSCSGGDTCWADNDNDGYGDLVDTVLSPNLSCNQVGEAVTNDDCDDSAAAVNPGAAETVDDGEDSDCDGQEDCYDDADDDGFGNQGGLIVGSADLDCLDANESGTSDDCNDTDATIHPDALEGIADLVDQNCDGDELCYADSDGDGYGDEAQTTVLSGNLSCGEAGESMSFDDCDDVNPNINPGAAETVADGTDQDCDGQERCYLDGDGDSFGDDSGATGLVPGLDCDVAGFADDATDCDDSRPDVNPAATELTADDLDSNCNGSERCYADVDHDTFGSLSIQSSADTDCSDQGESYTSDDCDDSDPLAYPGAPEIADDGIDQDCNSTDLVTCYTDDDVDGWGGDTIVLEGDGDCVEVGLSPNTGDCADDDPTRYPGAEEIPNDGIDQDCNCCDLVGCYQDLDLDGFGSDIVIPAPDGDCDDPGESAVLTDCDDGDAGINPDANDPCGDGLDQDCDGAGGPDDDEDGDTLVWTEETALGTDPCDQDSDADGLDDGTEDGVGMDPLSDDSDGDTVLDGDEVGADPNNPRDSDADGVIDPLDTDDDDDGVATATEALRGDSDGDGVEDYLDTDDDGDGQLTSSEDLDGDSDPINDDSDGDGVANYLDVDDDQDGVLTLDELSVGADPLSVDSDADGILDGIEWGYGDWEFDGLPNIIDPDDDDDGILTLYEGDGDDECVGYPDGVPNYLDLDSDGDGLDDSTEGDQNTDSDGDGFPDFLDCNDTGCAGDEDNDGLDNCTEAALCTDPLLADSDFDGLDDLAEVVDPANPLDTDGDGVINACDTDDDGDGMPTDIEVLEGDTDGDGIIDPLDVDDDGDGVDTALEDRDQDGDLTNDDLDGDGIPDYLDPYDQDGPLGDLDGDGLANQEEELAGSSPYSPDTDGDAVGDADEVGDPANPTDTDGDGIPDFDDPDDDGDGIPTIEETSADIDDDGVPNYLDEDSDGDGLPDRDETEDADCDNIADWADVEDEGLCHSGSRGGRKITNEGGCACSASPKTSGWWVLAILASAMRARRRRAA